MRPDHFHDLRAETARAALSRRQVFLCLRRHATSSTTGFTTGSATCSTTSSATTATTTPRRGTVGNGLRKDCRVLLARVGGNVGLLADQVAHDQNVRCSGKRRTCVGIWEGFLDACNHILNGCSATDAQLGCNTSALSNENTTEKPTSSPISSLIYCMQEPSRRRYSAAFALNYVLSRRADVPCIGPK